MYIKQEKYKDKLVQILYPEEGFNLQHKITHLVYSSVSLEDGRKQKDYVEVETAKEEIVD